MKDCLKNTFRPESGGPDPIPGGWEDTLVKGTVSFEVYWLAIIEAELWFSSIEEIFIVYY